jgi:hypothetical protein
VTGLLMHLQHEIVHRFHLHCFLDRGIDALRNENLVRFGDITEPGRLDHDITHSAVVVSPLEADTAEGRIANADPNTQPELVTPLAPADCERSKSLFSWFS